MTADSILSSRFGGGAAHDDDQDDTPWTMLVSTPSGNRVHAGTYAAGEIEVACTQKGGKREPQWEVVPADAEYRENPKACQQCGAYRIKEIPGVTATTFRAIIEDREAYAASLPSALATSE